jgi:flagellar assembly factor FliW
MEPQNAEQFLNRTDDIIRLPLGLLGFETVKNYVLLTRAEEAPFMWLQMIDDGKRAFLVVPPEKVVPDYQPEIGERDSSFLQLSSPEDAFWLTIVTMRPHTPPTVNLRGPIVINRRTLIGRQIIPNNAAGYALKHPLPTS